MGPLCKTAQTLPSATGQTIFGPAGPQPRAAALRCGLYYRAPRSSTDAASRPSI